MILFQKNKVRFPNGVSNEGTVPREIQLFSFPSSPRERIPGGSASSDRDSAARTELRDGAPPRGAGFGRFNSATGQLGKALSVLGVIVLVSALLLATGGTVFAQSMDGLVNQYQKEYEEVKPRPGSSVGTDYKLDQIAMGALYTVRSLSMLHDQNGQIIQNQQALMERYDRMIRQNDEVVRLLRRLVELREGPAILE